MTNFLRQKGFLAKSIPGFILCSLFATIFSCSNDKSTVNDKGTPYDPSAPVKLESFYPDSGGLATKVIIKGSNFGTDPEAVRVYYNQKRAAVVRANGNMLYVITPRQPGNDCCISVVVGKDSLQFDNTFSYVTQVTVSTVAGKPTGDGGAGEIIDGTLAEASFNQPWFVCVDIENNIFVSERDGGVVRMVNEEKNVVSTLKKGLNLPNAACTDPEGRKVFVTLDNAKDGIVEFDPETQWTPKIVKIRQKEGTPPFDISGTWMHSVAPNINDGLLYTRTHSGLLIRFDPRTKAGEKLEEGWLPNTDSFLSFDSLDPDILYLCYPNKHCIFRYNVITRDYKLYAGSQNVKGWLDGEQEDALFNDPKQICFDQDGVMYIADSGNHVIRKITRDGVVSTVIGLPGISGYVDGSPDDALFNTPTGIALGKEGVIYIGDRKNNSVRKLAIE